MLVKSIQVYRYEHAPSVGTVTTNVGNKKVINERKISEKYIPNLSNRRTLKITLRNLERHLEGIGGLADFEHIVTIKRLRDKEYYVGSIQYHFYISEKNNLLIIGGEKKHRDQLKNSIVIFFNNEISDADEIYFRRDPCFNLIDKLKRDGPMLNDTPRTILKYCKYYNGNIRANHGAEEQAIDMFDDDDNPTCVTTHPSFQTNFNGCESVDIKIRLFKCNAIWQPNTEHEALLEIRTNAEFIFVHNIDFDQWVRFITETCIEYLMM